MTEKSVKGPRINIEINEKTPAILSILNDYIIPITTTVEELEIIAAKTGTVLKIS